MVKVLHVFHCMDRGGAETMIMNLYRNIDRNKLQFGFIVHQSREGEYDSKIRQLGGELYIVPEFRGYNITSYKKKFREIFENHPEYTIVHGHMQSKAAIYMHEANRMGKITISHSHTISSGKGLKAIIKCMLQYPIRYEADYLFACSILAGKWLYGKTNVKKHKIDLIYNAVDIEQFRYHPQKRIAIRKRYGLEDHLVVGHVGRFIYEKNHELLIDIFHQFHKQHPDSILILLGNGEEEEKIKRKVREMKLNANVKFLGVQENVNEWMQAMDIFLLPSRCEGLPVVVVEAQVSGLPCVISEPITDEVMVHCVKKCPLKADMEQWVKVMENSLSEKSDREKAADIMSQTGFNIKTAAMVLQKKYLEMDRKRLHEKRRE